MDVSLWTASSCIKKCHITKLHFLLKMVLNDQISKVNCADLHLDNDWQERVSHQSPATTVQHNVQLTVHSNYHFSGRDFSYWCLHYISMLWLKLFLVVQTIVWLGAVTSWGLCAINTCSVQFPLPLNRRVDSLTHTAPALCVHLQSESINTDLSKKQSQLIPLLLAGA